MTLLSAAALLGRRGLPLIALTIPPVLLISLSSTVGVSGSVSVERDVRPATVLQGGRVTVRLKVSTDRPVTLAVRDSIDARARVSRGSTAALLRLGGSYVLEYEAELPKRGVYAFGPALVEFTDPLGLWKRVEAIGGESEVVAFPRPWGRVRIPLRARYTGPWPGEVPSRRSGRGTEFYGLREYVPGDELRRVNWRATARLGRLVSNEYVEERVTDVLLVVDAGLRGVLDDEEAERLVDIEASLAASLAVHLLRWGNRVGLVARGERAVWVRPGFGRRQVMRLLYHLAELKPGEPAPLDYALRMLVPYLLTPNAEVIAVTPLLDPVFAKSIRDLAVEYSVLILSPSPAPRKGVAWRLLELERRNVIAEVSRTCRVEEVKLE